MMENVVGEWPVVDSCTDFSEAMNGPLGHQFDDVGPHWTELITYSQEAAIGPSFPLPTRSKSAWHISSLLASSRRGLKMSYGRHSNSSATITSI